MDADQILIRSAGPADAEAMGHLHVRAWQHGYRGMMPDGYLDGLRPADRIDLWRDRLRRDEVDGAVAGFAALGQARDEASVDSGLGELYALNVDPPFWGRGVGRSLLVTATDALRDRGHADAILWVVRDNERARALYESEGWTHDGGLVTEETFGVTVTEVRYTRSLATGRPSR
jgi:ribosomal protein S18 acetylase RimI-like enzyme